MSLSEQCSIGEKADGRMRPFGISDRAVILVLAGIAGVLLSVGLAMSLFLRFVTIGELTAIVLYLIGLCAMILMTAGRTHWSVWPLRLLFPVPTALLVWWGLGALGL